MKKKIVFFISMLVILAPIQVFAASSEVNAQSFGIWTIIPPLLAIVLAFITKNVVLSLFIGTISGTFLISLNSNNMFGALYNSFMLFTEKLLISISDTWNAGILLQVLAIGGLIALVGKMGGAQAVAEALSKKAKSARSAQLITWVLGLFVFFDDYANSLIVGPIMRPVTDKMKISREKLAFIVDATAAPVAGLAIISTWVGYELSTIKDAFADPSVNMDVNAFSIFVQTLPYRFYNILMLVFVVLTAIMLKEFGPMLKAERRARAGKVSGDNAKPMVSEEATDLEPVEGIKLKVSNALIPIGTLIVCSFGGFYFNGLASFEGELSNVWYERLSQIFGSADASIVIFQAALFAGIVAMVMGVAQKIFSVKDAIETWIQGLKSLLITGVILMLAWSLSSTIKELGTSYYIVGLLQDSLPAFLLPSLIFILGCIISFATGTSYGTMGILMPLAVPISFALGNGDYQYMVMSVGAVLTGAILGDHCSPISDTTILSSMGSACDHIDHTTTQLPYSIVVGIASVIFGYIPVGLGVNIWIVLPISILLIAILLYVFGKSPEAKTDN